MFLINCRRVVNCMHSGVGAGGGGGSTPGAGGAALIARIGESAFKWISSNMVDLDLGPALGRLPTHDVVTVEHGGQTRRVGLLGLLTNDPALYRPGAFNGATITDVIACADAMRARLYDAEGVDLVVPMTHQVAPPPPALF